MRSQTLLRPLLLASGALLLTARPSHAELSLTRRNPSSGATAVCPDTPLGFTFNENVALGTAGQVKVIRNSDGKVVDTVDVAGNPQTNSYGIKQLHYEPFRIEGATVTVQLHSHVLDAEAANAFSIVVDPGVFQSASGEKFPGISNGNWQFATRPPLPKGKTRIEVAPDDHGDFRTLQGAVDYVPEDNQTPFEIHIRNGTYDSITSLGPGRNRIRLIGEDRKKTILSGRNNDKLNPGRMGRPFLSVDSDDVTIKNLTLRNTTPYAGSQAEALRMEGLRCTVRNCDITSYQDTLLLNGSIYVADCYIEGDVDFIWGHGTTFFEDCELKAMHDGYYVTSRNPADKFGFIFSNCKLTAAPGVKKNWLARIDADRFPDSAVAFINCRMGPHIPDAGWLITGNDTSRLRFQEFNSTTPDDKPLDISHRHAASHQLTATEAATLADANKVLSAKEIWKPNP
ncbi:MAG: pectinesterase family protein [Luteolibacter sp.]|uniref:pectinesterase family protein n=1 Tax=Luteolibacter sp. TaxID=1962973 RepID=UPI0032635C64